jgi:hypothetical protein
MTNSIDALKAKVSLACVPYQKIIKSIGSHPEIVVLLFEGEDEKYYSARIPNAIRYSAVICDGKSNVLKAMDLVDSNAVLKAAKVFAFVDRDHDEVVNKDRVYTTPVYSIENFYCSLMAFDRLVSAEFGIMCNVDIAEYEHLYQNVYVPFLQSVSRIQKLSAWFMFQRDVEKRSASDVRLNANKININEASTKGNKGLMKYIYEKCPKCHRWNKDDKTKYISHDIHKEPLKYYRGKWILALYRPLLIKIINDARNNKMPIKTKKKPELQIQGDGIGALSQYADTPGCLTAFIHEIQSAK